MKLLHAVVVAVLSLGLSSCVVSEQKFDQYRTVLRNRPDIRAQLMAKCVNKMLANSAEKRAAMAEMVDLKLATFPQAFCRRMEANFLSGRLTYADYRDVMAQRPTPRLIRLMRGK